MPNDPHDSVRQKVATIFTELAGSRELRVRGSLRGGAAHTAIALALSSDVKQEIADEIAFHMVDWIDDAAFLIALHLSPERFTADEIEAGIGLFLAHVPAHIIAAARRMGYSTEDFFAESDDD